MRTLLKIQLLHYLRATEKVDYRTNNWVLGQKVVRKNIEKIANFFDFIGSLSCYVRRERVDTLYGEKPFEFTG